jgi:Uma2 family endonuclease
MNTIAERPTVIHNVVVNGKKGPHTADDLLHMPDGDRFELINGHLVERHMGQESSAVAVAISGILREFVRSRRLGSLTGPDGGFQIFPEGDKKVRFPDVAFVAREKLPDGKPFKGHATVPPDLAVEVVSPNDTAEEVEAKRVAFLSVGVRLMWIVYPESRTVHVHRYDGTARILTTASEIDGDDVLPGFTAKVSDFFAD